jgi:hypothetical protein
LYPFHSVVRPHRTNTVCDEPTASVFHLKPHDENRIFLPLIFPLRVPCAAVPISRAPIVVDHNICQFYPPLRSARERATGAPMHGPVGWCAADSPRLRRPRCMMTPLIWSVFRNTLPRLSMSPLTNSAPRNPPTRSQSRRKTRPCTLRPDDLNNKHIFDSPRA